MPYSPPDTPPPADGVPQMPAAPNAGPAPVPYSGIDSSPEPPVYGVSADIHAPGVDVMGGVSGNALQESGYAHDVNAGLVVPYMPGSPQQIYTGADNDAGGTDPVAGTVAGAVANAEARFMELQGDTFALGSKIGDVMTFAPSPLDPGTAPGVTLPTGGFYDPPRNYGD